VQDAGGDLRAVAVEQVVDEGAGDGVRPVDLPLAAGEPAVEVGERDRAVDQQGEG